MKTNKLRHRLKQYLLRLHQASVPIRLRLLGFLLVLIVLLFLIVIMILFSTGTLTAGRREVSHHFQSELVHLSADIERDFGQISAAAVSMAKVVAKSSELFLEQKGIRATELQAHPELLQPLLDSQFDRLMLSLEKTRASGAFIIYDATVNERLANAETSRAGLYIKSLEPNIVSVGALNMTVLRGFADLGRDRDYALHALWSMEFDLNSLPEYAELAGISGRDGDLGEAFCWGEARPLPGSSELWMPCIVPLFDSNGDFFGVCGFEVSSMLFKLKYSPDTSHYKRMSCLICSVDDEKLQLTGALSGGDYTRYTALAYKAWPKPSLPEAGDGCEPSPVADPSAWLIPVKAYADLSLYRVESRSVQENAADTALDAWLGSHYIGMQNKIRLLPRSSVFSEQERTVVLLMPESGYTSLLRQNTTKISLLCLLFILIGIVSAVIISQRFVRPILRGLEAVATYDENQVTDSNIPEIQQLIEQLRQQHEQNTGQGLPDNLFEDFLDRLGQLTPTERQITSYYMKGLSTGEILAALFISASTLKTHSSHIYAKLNVSSRDELLLYYKLIEKSGRLDVLSKRL